MRTFAAILLFIALTTGLDHAFADQPNIDFQTINDEGGYHFGFNDGRLARQEERSADGVVRGAYTYVDANGQIQVVSYTADRHNGFLVSGTNVPRVGRIPEVAKEGEIVEVPPASVVQETPEVAAARAEHLEAVRRAQLGEVPAPVVAVVPADDLPLPVSYTPEVIEVRAAHFNAFAAEALRNRAAAPELNSKPEVVAYVVPNSHFHPDYLPYANL